MFARFEWAARCEGVLSEGVEWTGGVCFKWTGGRWVESGWGYIYAFLTLAKIT